MPMFAMFALSFALTAKTSAEPCVKIRVGYSVGNDWTYECLQFSKAQRISASKLLLHLATPYEAVYSQMSRQGWAVDRDWLAFYEADTIPVCGEGYDAICHIQMKKGNVAVLLTFSGANDGLPLIDVEPGE